MMTSNLIIMFQNLDFGRILTAALLITIAATTTSLTSTNCPTGYDFAAVNATADSSA
jgi:hypothetical protein